MYQKITRNHLIKSIWDFLLSFQRIILITSSIFILINICLNVVFRYILQMDLRGIEEINILIAFWLYFIGASYGTYTKSHINADLLSSIFKEGSPIKVYIDIIISIITLLLCVVLLYWATEFFIGSIKMGAKTTALNIPITLAHSSIFLSFIFMSLYFFVQFISALLKLN